VSEAFPFEEASKQNKQTTLTGPVIANPVKATDNPPNFSFLAEKITGMTNFRQIGGTDKRKNSVDDQHSHLSHLLLADRLLRRPAAYDRHLPLRYRPPTDFRRAPFPSLWAEEQAFLARRTRHSLNDRYGANGELIDADRAD
ncbi:unnamed protein product, partial [Amoebophrya sp. A25]